MPDDLIEQIDAIIEQRYGQGDRTAVIRELVSEALAARKKKGKPS
jgi:metal-responsive CopG/Arc/MetJ family transcriptional regulator